MLEFQDVLAISAAVFGVATWVVPPVRYLLSFRKKPRYSLAVVGRVIALLVLAGCLSVATLLLVLLTFLFAPRLGWAWLGLGAVIGFWLAFGAMVFVAGLRSRRARDGR